MCLQSVTKLIKDPTSKERWVYKAFGMTPRGALFGAYQDAYRYRRNRWITADGFTNPEPEYELGFHGFTALSGAKRAGCSVVILKVKLRYVTTHGTQGNYFSRNVLVGRQLFIPKDAVNLNT